MAAGLCKHIESPPTKYWYRESTGFPLSLVNSIEESIWPRPPKYRIYRSGPDPGVDDDQDSAHADYIELSLQLQFNERSRSKAP